MSDNLLKNPRTITFSKDQAAIRSVSAYDNGHIWHNIRCVTFLDENFNEISSYNPRNLSFLEKERYSIGEK